MASGGAAARQELVNRTRSATTSSRPSEDLNLLPEGSGYMSDDISGKSGPRGPRKSLNKAFRQLNFLKQRSNAPAGPRWFNPEELTAQKREWNKQYRDNTTKVVGWPSQMYESFIIVGLPPSIDIRNVVAEPDLVHRARSGDIGVDDRIKLEATDGHAKHRGYKGVPLKPQVLYQYPEGKAITPDAAHFCFPHGVQPSMLERTPSMSALNEMVYSQHYQHSDASSFIFVLKAADNLPLYGVCCYMEEVVHRPPTILCGSNSPSPPLSRYLVSAPRCYCFLTHQPFFSLHFKVLHMIMGLERLDRITAFMEEQSGPPRRSMGSVDTIPEKAQEGSSSGPASPQGNVNPSNSSAARAESKLRAETTERQMPGSLATCSEAESPGQAQVRAAAAASASVGQSLQAKSSSFRRESPSRLAPAQQTGAVHRMALALERASLALQERQSSFSTPRASPRVSPRDNSRQSSPAAGLPSCPSLSSADLVGERYLRSQATYANGGTSPHISPCDSAYDRDKDSLLKHDGHAPSGLERASSAHDEVGNGASQAPPEAVNNSGATGEELYTRLPPVNSAGLAKLQALLELQRQQDSMRLSSTRDLTLRVSSAQIPPLPPCSADGDAQPVSAENLRAQSQSFTGGQSSTPQSQRHRSFPRALSPAQTHTGPSLGRDSGRRLRLAQERMAAAVQAAEADRSETHSGRSTEDTEVNIMSSGQWGPESSEDSETSYATAHSQQYPTLASPQHHRQRSGDSLLGYTELDTPPRENRLQRVSIESRAASTASPLLHGQSSRLPDSPFTNSGEPSLKGTSGGSAQLDSADSRGLEGRASSETEAAALAGRASGGAEAAAFAGGDFAGIEAAPLAGRGSGGTEAAAQARRRELRSMSLRPAQESADSSEPSATASALEVMKAFYLLPVPQPGEEVEFLPDRELQPVHYARPRIVDMTERFVHRSALASAEAEAAEALQCWTVACLCRSLSIDNILTFLTAALLERQMVVFCPNIGILSAVVLSLIPLMRPFAWQSLLLPILPCQDKMLDLLEAPVPFILGVKYKTAEVAARCKSLTRVNIYKNRVKLSAGLPILPNREALQVQLMPSYYTLGSIGRDKARSRPLYSITADQKHAAEEFLKILQQHLWQMCAELYQHTITDVQTSERVSLLLKESFVESFNARDRLFMKQFVETQLFSVYCDAVMK